MSTRLRRTRSIQYTTRATNSTLAQPFSPVLRSVAHIKPIDKSQSSSNRFPAFLHLQACHLWQPHLFADMKQRFLARMRTALDEIEQNAPADLALFEYVDLLTAQIPRPTRTLFAAAAESF